MDRRAFIAGSAGGLLAVAPAAAAVLEAERRRAPFASHVANLRDHVGPAPLQAPGARLALERALERAFDPLSVAVKAAEGGGSAISAGGRVLAALMDAGLRFDPPVERRRGAVAAPRGRSGAGFAAA